jgi:ABC-type branched-subunit amino acid transport system substrate-binding protein
MYINNDYGIGVKDTCVKAFEAAGGKLLIVQSFELGAKDFRTAIWADFAYDAMMLVAKAIEKNGYTADGIQKGIRSGVHQVEISHVDDWALLDLASFGISVPGQGRFKINIDVKTRDAHRGE